MMNKKHALERLLEFPDDESYAEYLKLSQDEKSKFENVARARAEYYKNLTMEADAKLKELEKELKQKGEEYKRLKSAALKSG